MILKVSMSTRSMILLNVYRSPSKEEDTDRIVSVLCNLNSKYADTPIVAFGDLNHTRDKIVKKFNKLLENGFKFVYDSMESTYTRFQYK
jgi:hypothetical protein